MITTSSISVASSFNTTVKGSVFFKVISTEVIPIKENTKTTESLGSTNENSPLASVATPIVVPLIKIATPGKTSPLWSITFPVILNSCFLSGDLLCTFIKMIPPSSKSHENPLSKSNLSNTLSTGSSFTFTLIFPRSLHCSSLYTKSYFV